MKATPTTIGHVLEREAAIGIGMRDEWKRGNVAGDPPLRSRTRSAAALDQWAHESG